MVFSEVCHSCGGCMMVCPEGAITEKPKPIGVLEIGKHDNIRVVTGILNPGESSGVPVIREALKQAQGLTVIDCPPGSACSVMESVMDADYCVLVVEPTAFGFHNFRMVHELVTLLGKKCGILINKESVPYPPLDAYCTENNLTVLGRIPYDPVVASMTANGELIAESEDDGYHADFCALLRQIEEML
ncbi:MAG: 4Fe-4S binding protein, partial [Ruminococcus sp.]